MTVNRALYLLVLLTLASLALAGCNEPPPPQDFVSDNPNGGGGDDFGGGAGTGGGGEDGEGGDEGGDREVSEADIIEIEGDRLYALSRFAGLTVVDVAEPDDLSILGRYRVRGEPFEMYVDAGQVFVMYSNFGDWRWDEEGGGYMWTESSRLVALDASDPKNIAVRGTFDLPGGISDSRRVGDVLYVVTYEDGGCWGCQESPNTTVTSLNIANPAEPSIIDQIVFPDGDLTYGWAGPRPVSATNERLYVASFDWVDWNQGDGYIDVVDITDPTGDMELGTRVPVVGQIVSRWQMDEFEGVLRVVSQPGIWGSEAPPRVETFTVASASDVSPLGSVDMVLPRPESLRSVRFDGTRGFAITFERTDPLFTLDLSDPANPKQVGELEIPGWVYHMEVRGDRVLGLGFDRNAPEGSINVSLFDVSDFAQPTMMQRVHFGGDWADFAEDQNRVQKAFTILDDENLLLVPYSGWEVQGDELCATAIYRGGIQLIDWTGDDLVLRGVAPAKGRPRRARLHKARLLAMSDQAVQTFDILDRDAPLKTDELAFVPNVSQMARVGTDLLARYSRDWWARDERLELVPLGAPDRTVPLGSFDLSGLDAPDACASRSEPRIFGHGDFLLLVTDEWNFDPYGYEADTRSTTLRVFDTSDPSQPQLVGTHSYPFISGGYGYRLDDLAVNQADVVLSGDALMFVRSEWQWDPNTEQEWFESTLEVVDVSDPLAPVHAATLDRAQAALAGGLQVLGDRVVTWHADPVDGQPDKLRFYLDEIDVSNPAAPKIARSINVPGVPVAYRKDTARAITVDFQFATLPLSEDDCWKQANVHHYDHDANLCVTLQRPLKLVRLVADGAILLDTLDVDSDQMRLQGVLDTGERTFVHLSSGGNAYEVWGDLDPWAPSFPSNTVVTLDPDLGTGLAEASRVPVAQGWVSWRHGDVQGRGTTLAFDGNDGLVVLDASVAASPSVTVASLYGPACGDLELLEDEALCAMGPWGVQSVPLP